MRPAPDLPPEANAELLSLVVAEAAKRGLMARASTELAPVHAAWFLHVTLVDPDVEVYGRMPVDWRLSPAAVLDQMRERVPELIGGLECKVAELRAPRP